MKILWFRITDALTKAKFLNRPTVKKSRFTCLPAGEFSIEDFEFFITQVLKQNLPVTKSGVIRFEWDNRILKYWFEFEED